jgi:two-component system chemotaxis response regulator CheB
MTKLLIVDDSALMRKYLTDIFRAAGDFEIRTARNGIDGIEQTKAFEPDVITLDINMPDMDGLTALSRIMVESPRPVVMVSSLTEEGALATLEALELGAVDYIPKPGGTVSLNIRSITEPLVAKVRAAATARVSRARGLAERIRANRTQAAATTRTSTRLHSSATRPRPANGNEVVEGVVLIGVSTGGPRTLEEILPGLPGDFPWPVVIAQHMPAHFTNAFAKRIDSLCALEVVEAARPMPLKRGCAYIAMGDADAVLSRRATGLAVVPMPADPNCPWHPSVDRLVSSALALLEPEQLIGVLLTGMGNDGAESMAELRRKEGRTIAESEETAIVFGMPHELIRRGGAQLILRPEQIAKQLVQWTA